MNTVFPNQVAERLFIWIVIHEAVRIVIGHAIFINQMYIPIGTKIVNFPALLYKHKIQKGHSGLHILHCVVIAAIGAGTLKVAVGLLRFIPFVQLQDSELPQNQYHCPLSNSPTWYPGIHHNCTVVGNCFCHPLIKIGGGPVGIEQTFFIPVLHGSKVFFEALPAQAPANFSIFIYKIPVPTP